MILLDTSKPISVEDAQITALALATGLTLAQEPRSTQVQRPVTVRPPAALPP